jgi:hypothetical protein
LDQTLDETHAGQSEQKIVGEDKEEGAAKTQLLGDRE